MNLAEVTRHFPDRHILWHKSLPTTMTEASRLATNGCPHGTVVGAESQTAGQGRLGRTWYSEPGAGLYISIVLRLPFPAVAFPSLTMAIGLAAREAILDSTGITCDLRWPNDLLLGERKCGGILVAVETRVVIAGIGINVNHTGFREDLADTANSLRIASGSEHSRESLLIHLLPYVDRWCETLSEKGVQPILEAFESASSYVRNRRVVLDSGERGITAGLDETGFLLLRRDNGEVVKILAGGVRPV